jgi:signal transduction histidine kinase
VTQVTSGSLAVDNVLSGGGEMGQRMRSTDWSQTSVGPVDRWPQSLRSALSICLGSGFPIAIYWGSKLVLLYNDAWRPIPGGKHPWALGREAREVWPEIWDTIGPMFAHVMTTGEATYSEDSLLPMYRHGYTEECYFNFTFTPIRGEGGRVDGVFNAVIETTFRVVSERRTQVLRHLAERIARARSGEEACEIAAHSLGEATRDVPFCLLYVMSDSAPVAKLAGCAGLLPNGPATPAAISLLEPNVAWPLAEVRSSGKEQVISGLAERFGRTFPGGEWPEPADAALVVPLLATGYVAGFLVLGVNPRRAVDDDYRQFAERAASLIAAILAHANALEAERKRSEALAELDRAKTAFFSNVSHEFRTPLTLMLGPTEDALASPERALRGPDLETVHRNELRLLKLVNALLDFARIEAGRIQAAYTPTDLSAFTTDLASSFRSAMERAGLCFDVDCPPLPEPIYVDHDMWEKIVLNLLSNALKFTFEGSITVRMRWAGGNAELTVRDTGVGIAPSELPRLFERFHRIEGSRARTHEGSGIGLALVQELVRMHGGTIEVTSKPDDGTTFTITIPSGTAHLPPDRIGAPSSSESSSAGETFVQEALRWLPPPPGDASSPPRDHSQSRQAHILVADDNADMREYIARILRQRWRVDTAADGAEALEKVHRDRPDLVVADVMMPLLDGFGLVRALRSNAEWAGIPVVLLSARAGEEATAEGLRSGADDYLVKPFSGAALVVRVEAQLSAARVRKMLNQHEEAERQRMKLLVEEAPAAIAVLRGRDLVMEVVNALCVEVWGRKDASDLVGRPILEALPELREQSHFVELLHGVMATGKAYRAPEALVRMDRTGRGAAQDYYFTLTYAPLRAANGTVDGVFVYAFDVTEQVLARRDAEVANRLKDEFLATMSHELRTPLTSILGWATLLRRAPQDRKLLDRGLATIERNANMQARLIDDVLDVSRIISGRLRLDLRRVDMNAVVRGAIDVVRPAADAKRVHLNVDLPAENGIRIVGDADRLHQVIWNLLSNAVKFVPADGTVWIRLEQVGSDASIVVRDTGPGIPHEHLPYIFERFRQVDSSTTRKHGGLGLGLAIVRHLVELHGGSVSATSEGLGLGATFTVRLPIGRVHDAPTPAEEAETIAEAARAPAPLASALANLNVLVIDDDDDSRLLVEHALSREGASVKTVDSARAGLAYLEKHRVNIVISDIGMPEEDGFSLMRRIRALPASRGGDVPAIALSAYTRAEDVSRALEVGYQHHMAKPVDVDALLRAVAAVHADR